VGIRLQGVLLLGVLALGATLAAGQPAGATQSAGSAQTRVTPTDRKGTPNSVVERVLREWPYGSFQNAESQTADDQNTETQGPESQSAWGAQEGILLDGMLAEWRASGDGRLFAYAQAAVDRSVDAQGVIHLANGKDFPAATSSLGDIEMGRTTVTMYRVLQQPKYYVAARFLHDRMLQQPKTASGAYSIGAGGAQQLWLDSAFMTEPFMAAYARAFHSAGGMDEVATQLLLIEDHMLDKPTGLLRRGWDESHTADWADKKTGLSAEASSFAIGLYSMALVDVLEQMPESNPQRAALSDAAAKTLNAVVRYQDAGSGLWWQVMDKGGAQGNVLEASASCMFVYAIVKAVRLGVASPALESVATRAWSAIQTRFVQSDGTLSGTVKSFGSEHDTARGGSFDFYAAQPIVDNDPQGVGAYLLALSEVTERQRAGDLARRAHGRTVLMDAWFNSDTRKNADGQMELYRYKWDDASNSGYSTVARMFRQYGMRTETLDHAPRAEDLKGVEIYVIVSPDPETKPNAHLMDKESADAIEAWVKAGGVLLEMENDSVHADQQHFNRLSDRFGLHFNSVDTNSVDTLGQINDSYDNAIVEIPAGTGGIFRDAHRALEKDTCTLTTSGAAKVLLTDHGEGMMAVSHAGKGLVFANVDPWIYNEYTDGRQAPLEEDNFAAGQELVRWLVFEALTH
jgi:unsaturated rhamnogalacturonyl hydrolase